MPCKCRCCDCQLNAFPSREDVQAACVSVCQFLDSNVPTFFEALPRGNDATAALAIVVRSAKVRRAETIERSRTVCHVVVMIRAVSLSSALPHEQMFRVGVSTCSVDVVKPPSPLRVVFVSSSDAGDVAAQRELSAISAISSVVIDAVHSSPDLAKRDLLHALLSSTVRQRSLGDVFGVLDGIMTRCAVWMASITRVPV